MQLRVLSGALNVQAAKRLIRMQIPEQLIHQTQPCGKSCASTCVAMLLGVPAADIKDEFHRDYMGGKNIDKFLAEKGVVAEPLLSNYRFYEDGALYLITVPSLNMEARTHQVIFDYRDGFEMFDPCMGRPGKRYYVWKKGIGLLENEVEIVSWSFDYKVIGD